MLNLQKAKDEFAVQLSEFMQKQMEDGGFYEKNYGIAGEKHLFKLDGETHFVRFSVSRLFSEYTVYLTVFLNVMRYELESGELFNGHENMTAKYISDNKQYMKTHSKYITKILHKRLAKRFSNIRSMSGI